MAGPSLFLFLAVAAVPLRGGSTCPTPAEVAARIDERLDAKGHLATVEAAAQGIRLDLVNEAGAVVATKLLAGAASCSELASAAAVVLSAWLVELRGTEEPLELPVSPLTQAPSLPPGTSTPAMRLEVSAGLLGSLAADRTFALGALLSASLVPGPRGLGGQISLGALGSRDLGLAGGRATWQRFAAAFGGFYRFALSGWNVDAALQGTAAVLAIDGDELIPGATATHFDPGLMLGLRACAQTGPWVGAYATGWFFPRAAAAGPERANLPQFELLLAAGWSFGTK
ncbi:MAG: hypothetical protein ACOZIN_03485 [Myxococcota bacterium]